jgi:hypothetical protein
MGKSYIKYKGYGFWSRDGFTERWLLTLTAEMRKEPMLEQWQQALIDHWLIQSEIDAGCMWLGLDEHLEETAKRQFVLALSRKALHNADRFGATQANSSLSCSRGN